MLERGKLEDVRPLPLDDILVLPEAAVTQTFLLLSTVKGARPIVLFGCMSLIHAAFSASLVLSIRQAELS